MRWLAAEQWEKRWQGSSDPRKMSSWMVSEELPQHHRTDTEPARHLTGPAAKIVGTEHGAPPARHDPPHPQDTRGSNRLRPHGRRGWLRTTYVFFPRCLEGRHAIPIRLRKRRIWSGQLPPEHRTPSASDLCTMLDKEHHIPAKR